METLTVNGIEFERFVNERPDWRCRVYPSVGLQKSGQHMTLNLPGYEALGKPKAVALFFDKKRRRIALKKTSPTEPYAVKARPQSHKGQRPNNYILSVGAFIRHYSIDTSVSRRYPAEMDGDMLVIDLKE